MISALLAILKFLGILLLFCLGLALLLLLLVLFVPVRYRLTARRKIEEEVPIAAEVKITWLLHILNITFSYPKAAYVRVRLFCFTLFRTGKSAKKESDSGNDLQTEEEPKKAGSATPASRQLTEPEMSDTGETMSGQKRHSEQTESLESGKEPEEEEPKKSIIDKFVEFFRKLFETLRNIRYTIAGIYDKIKQVVNNIQYYIKIIKSDTFSRAWGVCSKQALSLLKSIGPRKVSGTLLIGTGDPASTGEVMAAYGILYPLIGEHIEITPDFERQIVEGDLLVRGKITVFKALKTAWIIYFNKDMRRLIKLFKREAA